MKILFVSLGCDKNRVDTEVMLGYLSQHGHEFTDDEELAEAVVINTCCFIGDAKEESINTILEMAERRKSGQLKALIVTGCLAQRYKEEIIKEIPEVDKIIGITAIDKIVEAVDETIAKTGKKTFFEDLDRAPFGDNRRVQTTGGNYNYLKIAEGCNKRCTYCIIPKVRGNYRSVPMEQLISEANRLAEAGVSELILVAQETTLYGVDLYGKKSLPELLHKLGQIEGIKWIRVLYLYPEEMTPEIIAAIKNEPKVCHYIDIPIQSGSDNILKRMGRATNNAEIRERIAYVRQEIPDICIRTTFITGFPGETADDFNQTMKLIKDVKFDRVGAFAYSQEEDTPAAEMPDQVSERVKKTRRTKIMKAQQEIAFESARNTVGRVIPAVIEGRITDSDDTDGLTYVARTYKDAPDVDGYLFINGVQRELMSGDFVTVRVTGSYEYDLIGELCDESSK